MQVNRKRAPVCSKKGKGRLNKYTWVYINDRNKFNLPFFCQFFKTNCLNLHVGIHNVIQWSTTLGPCHWVNGSLQLNVARFCGHVVKLWLPN